MQEDHERLEWLRHRGDYWEFRGGLLRHIGLEEKILLPYARRGRGGEPLPLAGRLREDHGLLATLLVPPPSGQIEEAIDRVLVPHNALEEGPEGVYAQFDALAGNDAATLAARLRSAPAVRQRPHQNGPQVRIQVQRALELIGARGH
jgi:hypothetical protein